MVRAGVILGACLAATPVSACRLALVLALDISSSVDAAEDQTQRNGLAAALIDPRVTAALLHDPQAPVALAVFEWSGRYQQEMVLEWTLLENQAAILNAAEAIANSERSYAEFPTSLGYALGYAAGVFQRVPFGCTARTLDVSGDGINNDGFGPGLAYANFPLGGVTVNGLAIGGHDPQVSWYYQDELIRGPGAFVEEARDYDDFGRAIRRKLLREVQVPVLGSLGVETPDKG